MAPFFKVYFSLLVKCSQGRLQIFLQLRKAKGASKKLGNKKRHILQMIFISEFDTDVEKTLQLSVLYYILSMFYFIKIDQLAKK